MIEVLKESILRRKEKDLRFEKFMVYGFTVKKFKIT